MYPPSALSLPEMPRHYRPGLDVVRLAALLPVLCYHYCIEAARLGFAVPTALLGRGMADWVELGLAWFFLLSGAALCLQWQGRFALRRYLAGRAAATYPAFWLGFAALFLYGEVLHGNNADILRWRVIFSLLGLDGYLTPVTVTFYKIGEWFLGVILILYSNEMADQEMLFEVVHGLSKSDCCQRLLHIAKNRGAPDNVTVTLAAV